MSANGKRREGEEGRMESRLGGWEGGRAGGWEGGEGGGKGEAESKGRKGSTAAWSAEGVRRRYRDHGWPSPPSRPQWPRACPPQQPLLALRPPTPSTPTLKIGRSPVTLLSCVPAAGYQCASRRAEGERKRGKECEGGGKGGSLPGRMDAGSLYLSVLPRGRAPPALSCVTLQTVDRSRLCENSDLEIGPISPRLRSPQ